MPKASLRRQPQEPLLPDVIRIVPPEGLLVPPEEAEGSFGQPGPVTPSTPVPGRSPPGPPAQPSPPKPRGKPSPSPSPGVKAPSAPAPKGGSVPPSGDKSHDADRVQGEINTLQDELDRRLAQLVAMVRKRKQSVIQAEIVRLRASLDVKRQQHDSLERQVEKLREECAKFGSSTVDIEMLRENLKQLESIYSELNHEWEKVKVELRAAPRITLLERAEAPWD